MIAADPIEDHDPAVVERLRKLKDEFLREHPEALVGANQVPNGQDVIEESDIYAEVFAAWQELGAQDLERID